MFSEVYIIVYLAYLADAILDIGVFDLDSNLHTCAILVKQEGQDIDMEDLGYGCR